MNKVFIINGSGAVGKDLFVTNFSNCCIYPILNISTIDPIKKAMVALGISPEKTDKFRKFASDLKDMCTREYNISYNYIIDTLIDEHKHSPVLFSFCHCREPEEITKLKEGITNDLKIPCETILIKRNLNHVPDNHADQNVENYTYDHIVYNDGSFDEYEKTVVDFYNLVTNFNLNIKPKR